ncbi:MAG TPA: START domain-containing protein [Solimonas sp.]|nr:START domain-containing protein [Solimonas sp.]
MPASRNRPERAARFVAAAFSLWTATALATDLGATAWTLTQDRDGIQIFTARVSGSPLLAVKGVGLINAPADRVVALLRDVPARPSWDPTCASASVLRTLPDGGQIIYLHSRLPWPAKDRDVVFRALWSISPDSGVTSMRADVATGELPPRKDRLRIVSGYNTWVVSPDGQGQSEVATEVHLDPGGQLPKWLLNHLSNEVPFDVLRGLRAAVEADGSAPDDASP